MMYNTIEWQNLYSAIIRNAETLEIPGPTLDFNDLGFFYYCSIKIVLLDVFSFYKTMFGYLVVMFCCADWRIYLMYTCLYVNIERFRST